MNEVAKCRRDHNRLGFAYRIGFARLFNRFPAQQPLEINDELLSFVAVQMNIDPERISDYASWQHTVSEHQARIQQYLGLRPFDLDESNALERFAFEESCRLEQTAPLLARAQEFLKEQRVVFPAESALLRLVGEQKKLAHESIVTRIADSFPSEMAKTINRLLDVQPGETVSALQKIKANPAKSSAPAMNALMHKMAAIEATGILGIDLSWLNANYQRAMFHYVRKCTADRLRELAGPRRLATLTCFLRQSYRDTIDQAVDMFDKIIVRMQADTARELDFLPQEQWAFQRETFFQHSGLPSDPNEVAGYLKARLNRAYDLFLQTAPGNRYASVDEDGWCLSVDSPEKPGKEADEQLDRLKSWLGRHMRTTRLTDMLIEVDNDIRFTDHFLPPAQKGKRDRKEICTILAAVLGHGCNLGGNDGRSDSGHLVQTAQARERLADDPGGAARGSRRGRARNLTPGYNDLLGRGPDSGERRAALHPAAQGVTANLQHMLQRLRSRILYLPRG
jgi:Domain of unknown function (DUF4158)/Tn3 transposase DDE domain